MSPLSRPCILGGLLVAVLASSAQAAINVSTDPTQNMNCSGGVCTATAQKAYLNVNDVTNMLAAGNLKIATAAGAQDIHIQAPFSWTSTSRLTLDAQRSIEFQKPVTVAGTGALTLITNDGGTGGDYWFDRGASVSFWDASSSLIINGQSFTLVKDIKTLAADIAANSSGNFALANSYDASSDGRFKNSPVQRVFRGMFEGLGQTISNLTIRPTRGQPYIGMFARIASSGIIRDISLSRAEIQGLGSDAVGGLVGVSYGAVSHAHVDGEITASIAGGLIGGNASSATVSDSSSAASVIGGACIGGLVGENAGLILRSSAIGSVTTDYQSSGTAGGLACGQSNSGVIDSSYASGTVNTPGVGSCAGGLIYRGGTVRNSRASGPVSAPQKYSMAGGLACDGAAVLNSSATGQVTVGYRSIGGGLLGRATSAIESSHASGAVVGGGGAKVGGLVGALLNDGVQTMGHIERSYSVGSAQSGDTAETGGMVGYKDRNASISESYSIGVVAAGADAVLGGFLGVDNANHHNVNHLASCYWDLDTSGINDPSRGAGNIPNDPGITGLTDADLKARLPAGFDPKAWGENKRINNGYPYLLANPPPKNAPGKRKVRH